MLDSPPVALFSGKMSFLTESVFSLSSRFSRRKSWTETAGNRAGSCGSNDNARYRPRKCELWRTPVWRYRRRFRHRWLLYFSDYYDEI